MAIQGLDALCIPISLALDGQQLCLTIPGQAIGSPAEKFCVTMPTLNFSDFDMANQLIAQLNAALFPYMPYIDAAAALVELFQCVSGLVKLFTKLDPTSPPTFGIPDVVAGLGDSATCLQAIRQKINAMLRALPPYSFLKIVYDATAVIQAGVAGMRNEFLAMLEAQLQILQRGFRASRFGGTGQFQLAIDCANANVSLQLQSLSGQAAPLQNFMTVISFLAQTAGAATGSTGSMNMTAIGETLTQAQESLQNIQSTEEFQTLQEKLLLPFTTMIEIIGDFRSNVRRALEATQPPQI